MISGKNLKKEATKEGSKEQEGFSTGKGLSLLHAKIEWCVLVLCSILFFCVPLFYLSLPKCANCGNEPNRYFTRTIMDKLKTVEFCEKCTRLPAIKDNLSKDKWKRTTTPPYDLLARKVFSIPLRDKTDFYSVRTVNAEYKLVIFLALASVVIGIVLCALHLKKRLLCIPKPLLLFAGLFLGSVLLSSVFAHNSQRAWASALLWHFVPVLFAFSLAHVRWNRKKTAFCLGSLLLGGIASCLVAMDQHYEWNKWNWQGLVINLSVPAGLIFNHNFAAEYHAPLITILLGLIFHVRSIGIRIALGLTLAFVFLPVLSLSLARGAWVGLMGGCCITLALLLVAWIVRPKKSPENQISSKSFIPPGALLALALALPFYIYTSNHWNKDSWIFSSEKSDKGISLQTPPSSTVSKETAELKSITNFSKADVGIQRRLALWADALSACLSSDFLVGKGTDHYELHFHESAKLSDQTTGATLVRFIHNDFIQTLYENGLIGLIGFLGIWGWAIWRGLLSCLERANESDINGLGLRLGLISASLVFLGEAFFEFPTRSPCALMVGWTTFGILLGILLQEKTSSDGSTGKSIFRQGPRLNLALGALGVLIIPCGCLLAKDLFWTNVYHVQGRVAGDSGAKDKSLAFHRKAISYAPWEHHSRKFECYYLLTHLKRIPQAQDAIAETLRVHPGCLVAHQNKIAVYLNTGKGTEARQAYLDMKKAAPFHHFTQQEGQRIEAQIQNSAKNK